MKSLADSAAASAPRRSSSASSRATGSRSSAASRGVVGLIGSDLTPLIALLRPVHFPHHTPCRRRNCRGSALVEIHSGTISAAPWLELAKKAASLPPPAEDGAGLGCAADGRQP